MSKVSFTVAVPHDRPAGSSLPTPQFFLSCNNNTYLSVKGKDVRGARWGNGNVQKEWKNRFEYSVTAAKGITKFSLIMNTSTVLPPLSWALAGDKPKAKDKEGGDEKKKKVKGKRGNSKDSGDSRDREPRQQEQAKLVGSGSDLQRHHRIHERKHREHSESSGSSESSSRGRGDRVHRRDREHRRHRDERDRDERDERDDRFRDDIYDILGDDREDREPTPPRIEDSRRTHEGERHRSRRSHGEEREKEREKVGEPRHRRRKRRRSLAQYDPAFGDVVGDQGGYL